jgi:hypothetical protein
MTASLSWEPLFFYVPSLGLTKMAKALHHQIAIPFTLVARLSFVLTFKENHAFNYQIHLLKNSAS